MCSLGNPLHSTAIEEDLSSPKVTQMAKSQVGKNITQKVKKIVKTRQVLPCKLMIVDHYVN